MNSRSRDHRIEFGNETLHRIAGAGQASDRGLKKTVVFLTPWPPPRATVLTLARRGVWENKRMSPQDRPLSPFLTIYRPEVTSVFSIIHRLSGVAVALGSVVLAWWLLAAAVGPDYFEFVRGVFATLPGRLVLFGLVGCMVYHSLNGIRHLIWDAGGMLEKSQVMWSAWLTFGASIALTLVLWYSVFGAGMGLT